MEKIMIDDWVDALPWEREIICVQRAFNALGYPYELAEGTLIVEDPDSIDVDDFSEALHEEYKRMYANEMFAELLADGDIRPDGVAPNGEVMYTAVD